MAGIGPFESIAWPGVYTKTLNEAPTVSASGGLRVPAFIGVADEVVEIPNFEMIRGSNGFSDNPIIRDNVSDQFTGANRNFTVSFFPIYSGTGAITNDPRKVTVYVDDNSVPVASVNGTTGEIYLVSIPAMGAVVQCSYYYKRLDTLYTNEDVSNQADGSNVNFKVDNVPIVSGDNGGITTTDPTKVTVKVNNIAVTVSAVDGDVGIITLAAAPISGATVTVTYYSNEYPDTADILPTPNFSSMIKVGLSPGTSDFIEGTDFVIDSTGDFATVQWGHSYKIASGRHTIATEYFDDTQVAGTPFDNRNFRRRATGTADGTNKLFSIATTPVDGQGRGWVTDDPSKVGGGNAYAPLGDVAGFAYYGTSPSDATAIVVKTLDASLRQLTLLTAPPADSTVFVTQYVNILPDDAWTLTNTVAGASGVGKYTMSGAASGTAMNVELSTSDSTVDGSIGGVTGITFPSGTGLGNSDAQVLPGYAVAETVLFTFQTTTRFTVSSSNPSGSGTVGDNTGYLNQTYIDARTGLRATLTTPAAGAYVVGNRVGFTVSPTFTAAVAPTRSVPGIRVTVTNTTGVGVTDTAVLNTYNLSGNEPDIGDFYYVSFFETKTTFNTGLFFTLERTALTYTGPLGPNNKLGMAAHLCFLNGAAAVVLYQIPRSVGGSDAPDSAYIAGIDYFNEPMPGGLRPTLMEPVTASVPVLQYLKISNVIQSGIRYGNEHVSYFGFALNTTPTVAQTFARALNSERMIGLYPDGGITTITDELGNGIEYLVDGSLLAAAVAGRDTSPAFDVAEPLTRKQIVGFTRLYRRMDSVTALQTANSGLTVLEETAGGIIIKLDLTTDLTSVLTRTPSVIRIKDFVQRGTRAVLDPYIGTKFLAERTSEIEQTLGSYMSALKRSQIIQDFSGIKATVDPNDATTVNVVAYYAPVLPLLWILVTFNLRSKV